MEGEETRNGDKERVIAVEEVIVLNGGTRGRCRISSILHHTIFLAMK